MSKKQERDRETAGRRYTDCHNSNNGRRKMEEKKIRDLDDQKTGEEEEPVERTVAGTEVEREG